MDRFVEVSAFVEVARRQSFVAAAHELDWHVSAVSRAVAALEKRLGVRLLQRTTRRVALTEAGRAYFQRCETLLGEFDGADAAVRDLGTGLSGTLRVSLPSGFGLTHIAPVIGRFVAAHPQLRLDLNLSNRFVDLVEEGYDLALRIGTLADSQLIARRLAPNRQILVASPAYLAQHAAPKQPGQLTKHACLVHVGGTFPPGRWELVRGEQHAQHDADGPLRSNNALALLAACRAGVGILLVAEVLAADDLRSGALKRVLPGWSTAARDVYAVYPSARFVPAKVRAFVDFVTAYLAGAMPERGVRGKGAVGS
jgi:DNA-binding transcriptional LysR family regulator